MVTQLLAVPGANGIGVQHQLLLLLDMFRSVLVSGILPLVCPGLIDGNGPWLNWLTFLLAWITYALNCQRYWLRDTELLSFGILSGYDVIVIVKFDILEGQERIILVDLMVFLQIYISVFIDIIAFPLLVLDRFTPHSAGTLPYIVCH